MLRIPCSIANQRQNAQSCVTVEMASEVSLRYLEGGGVVSEVSAYRPMLVLAAFVAAGAVAVMLVMLMVVLVMVAVLPERTSRALPRH